jgi:hypothetical protein
MRDTSLAMAPIDPALVSAHDVAQELRRRVPDAGQAQVHEWSYYAQAWHLVLGGDPLFDEEMVPIPGTKRAARVEENAAADQLTLSVAQRARLDALSPTAGARYPTPNWPPSTSDRASLPHQD